MNVYEDIVKERLAQDVKWGGPDHDDRHGGIDWLGYIESHVQEAYAQLERDDDYVSGWRYFNEEARQEFRRVLIQVAALAVAAVESLDRKRS